MSTKEKAINPKQEKTKKPKTIKPAEKKRISGKIWIIAAVLSLCVCIGIVVAGMDWTAVTETVEQLAAEQTEPVETQPEETLSPEAEAYNEAVDFFHNGEYGRAAIAFAKLGDFRDAKEISHKIWDAIAVRDTIGAGYEHTVALRNDGTVIACGNNSNGECNVSGWTDIVAVSAGTNYTLGLKADGTVVATGKSGIRQINVDGWKDIVAIDAGQVIAYGLRSDGTVLTTGNDDFQKEVSTLMNIVSVDALDHWNYFCAVEADGTLVEQDGLEQVKYFSAINVDDMIYDNFEISQWQDVREFADGFHGLAKLKTDGTVRFEFYRDLDISRKFDTEDWQNMTAISMGTTHLLGLKADGTVMATGDNGSKQCAVDEWTDIVSVKAGQEYSVGLKSDGTLVTTGSSRHGKRLTSEWTDIRIPADRDALLSAIRPDSITADETSKQDQTNEGTEEEKRAYNQAVKFFEAGEYGKAAIAFGKLGDFRDAREVSLKIWNAIADREVIGSGYGHVAALKADGTVLAAGTAENGRCEVDSWTQIAGISVGTFNTVAIRADGTVFAVGDNQRNECDVGHWTDIASVYSTGFCTFGLRSDGTIIYAGDAAGSEEVTRWEDIVSIGISNYLVGLKSDGTVIYEENPYFDLSNWRDIVQISAAGTGHVIGLKADGTVVTAGVHGESVNCNCDTSQWADIIDVSAGITHFLGLKKDGTVVASGSNSGKQCDVDDWKDIVDVQTGYSYSSFGITSDGKVLTAGTVKMGDVVRSDWKNIRQPVDRKSLLAQIHPGQTQSEKPVQAEPAMPEFYYQENVLMEVKDPDNLKRDSKIFNTTVMRDDVASITFLDTLQGAPKRTVDASQEKNGKVKAWAVEKGDLYDIYVAAEGGVCPPANAEKLFAEMPALSRINFGDAFCTDRVTNMSGMFSGCKSLTELDVSGFDTSVVTDMSYLFYGCEKLTDLKLDQWDTSCVTNMQTIQRQYWMPILHSIHLSR